jgi:hypothetical protein
MKLCRRNHAPIYLQTFCYWISYSPWIVVPTEGSVPEPACSVNKLTSIPGNVTAGSNCRVAGKKIERVLRFSDDLADEL